MIQSNLNILNLITSTIPFAMEDNLPTDSGINMQASLVAIILPITRVYYILYMQIIKSRC